MSGQQELGDIEKTASGVEAFRKSGRTRIFNTDKAQNVTGDPLTLTPGLWCREWLEWLECD
jgi:hypothetical protein